MVLRRNIVRGVEGNTGGCHPNFAARLGIGLYLDNFSRDLEVEDNTIEGASWVGLLFQNSTGSATGNILYGNASGPWGTQWGSQLDLRGNGITSVAQSGNRLVALEGQPLQPHHRSRRPADGVELQHLLESVLRRPAHKKGRQRHRSRRLA